MPTQCLVNGKCMSAGVVTVKDSLPGSGPVRMGISEQPPEGRDASVPVAASLPTMEPAPDDPESDPPVMPPPVPLLPELPFVPWVLLVLSLPHPTRAATKQAPSAPMKVRTIMRSRTKFRPLAPSTPGGSVSLHRARHAKTTGSLHLGGSRVFRGDAGPRQRALSRGEPDRVRSRGSESPRRQRDHWAARVARPGQNVRLAV